MNAFSTGDGNVFIHLGLLSHIKKIDELIFTICHELAHDELDHSMKRFLRAADLENDKAFKAKIKKLNRQEYNYREKAAEVLLSVISEGMHFSQAEELQADSLGMIFFMNTGQKNSRSAYSLLKRLKEDNYMTHEAHLDWNTIMQSAGLTVQQEWFGQESLSMQNMQWAPRALPDSLLSHPNIEKRIETLHTRYQGDTAIYNEIDPAYSRLRMIAHNECLYSWIQIGNYDRAFFEACKLYQNGHRTFSPLALGYISSKLLLARKARCFGYYVAQESKDYSPNFNQ